MRVRGEIVFPNNIKQLRLAKRLTQAELGRRMEPAVAESTISKIESGERRPTNLQLADLAFLLGCAPDALPVVASRDPAPGVQRWRQSQELAMRHSIESGAAAAGYVLAQLRKKSGKTMQQVAAAIGMTLSVYHRVEMASRMIKPGEIEAAAVLYGLTTGELVGLFERRAQENRAALDSGVPAAQLLPRVPRALLAEDGQWGRLGALERAAIRRSIRYVAAGQRQTELPVHGEMTAEVNGQYRFVIDRNVVVDSLAISDVIAPDTGAFLIRNHSQRLGFLLKPGAIAYIDPQRTAAVGDIVFVVRHDQTADAAVVIGDGLGHLSAKMYNPEEEMALDDQRIAALFRIQMLIMP
jgi:transcriptional regulator with XRE-family HTH domain